VFILSLDTASPAGSIAVLDDEKLIAVISTATDETYSSRMFRQLEFLLGEVKLSLDRMDLFAVNAGPGSFTGLRVALTATKGWAEVYTKPAVAVSGLEAVAVQSNAEGPLIPLLDAHRGQVYFGVYGRSGDRLISDGPDRVATPEEFWTALAELPTPGTVTVVTPDAKMLAQLSSHSETRDLSFEQVSSVLAPSIGRLAYSRARRGDVVDALTLDANYVRRSDAELHWKGPDH